MKQSKRTTKRILQKENTQSNKSETTVRCNNPDFIDHALNRMHPVLGYLGDVLQSSGKPFSKIEAKQSGLGQTIVEQVKSVNKSVEEIIKNQVKVPNGLDRTKSESKFKPIPRPKPKNMSPAPKLLKFVAYPKPVSYPEVEPIKLNSPMMPPPPNLEEEPTPPDDPNNPYASLPNI